MKIKEFVADVKRRAYCGDGSLFMMPEEAAEILGVTPTEFREKLALVQKLAEHEKILVNVKSDHGEHIVFTIPDRGCKR